MFNRSAILTDAWAAYRLCQRGKPFNRKTFGFYLGCAWDRAKAAQMTPIERRKVAIEVEIERLKYRDARVNIDPMRKRLQSQLATLAA